MGVGLAKSSNRRGQTLVETALVLPLFIAIVAAILVFGIGLFYQQQITTVARESARYAAVHSASSNCPVGGWLPPAPGTVPNGAGMWDCDSASAGWPNMTARAREYAFGLDPTLVFVTACWSGYHDTSNPSTYDAGPIWANDGQTPNPWFDCTMDSVDPLTDTDNLPCPAITGVGDDTASNLAVSDRELAVAANQVVLYACYNWSPPLAGFLLIPDTVVLRAVFSEGLQHQR
jgi:hypothetical protein